MKSNLFAPLAYVQGYLLENVWKGYREVTGERIQCNEKPVMSTTLYWCKQCNVPIYEESCPLCGEKGKYIATDIRPVFPEEKILLAILLEKDDPLCFEELSVWNNTNFYFIDGEKIQVSIRISMVKH